MKLTNLSRKFFSITLLTLCLFILKNNSANAQQAHQYTRDVYGNLYGLYCDYYGNCQWYLLYQRAQVTQPTYNEISNANSSVSSKYAYGAKHGKPEHMKEGNKILDKVRSIALEGLSTY